MKKFQFGIASHKTLPFALAGLTFFSKPLTVAEELPLAELGDQFDANSTSADETRAFIAQQCDILAGMLRARLATEGQDAQAIDQGWAMRHLGLTNTPNLLEFLRSGKRPSGNLELGLWTDEPIEIDNYQFAMRQLSFGEQLLGLDFDPAAGMRGVVDASAKMLAALLDSRLLGWQEGQTRPAITPEWVQEHLTSEDMTAVQGLLQNGPEAEGDDPNAEGGAENLTLAAAGELTTS